MKWLPYVLFPLGIFIGYIIPSPQQEETAASEAPPTRSNRPRPTPEQSQRKDRVVALADSFSKNKRSERPDVEEEVAIGDIPDIIELLLQQAGPSGLSWELQSSIKDMMRKWAEEDFHGALSWATTHPNRNAAKDFLETILKVHASENFDETIAIITSLQNEAEFNLDLGSQLLEEASKRGARQAFELLALFPSTDGGYGGSSATFPPDFDFKTFAELVSAHLKKSKGLSSPFEHFPTNVYEEWAKTDLEEALEFYLNEGELTYGDLGDITKSFLDISEPSSTYPWLAEQFVSLEGESRKIFASSLDGVFPYEMGAKPLIGLLESIPDTAVREEMLGYMLEDFGTMTRGDEMTYLDLLTVLPSPQQRLEAIDNINMRYSILRQSDEKLAILGITRQQVEALGND